MSADRCPTCDREGCLGLAAQEAFAAFRMTDRPTKVRAAAVWQKEYDRLDRLVERGLVDCRAHRVDWRARSIADRAARDAATRRLAAVEEAVEAARKRLGKLVDHFDAMDGEEDSSQLAYDLQAISDGLRAALEKQP